MLAYEAAASVPLEVVGLFRDRAVVRAAGGEKLLKVGESLNGVTLLSADAAGATVRYQGETYEVALSNRVSGTFQPVQQAQLVLTADRLGQYQVRGAVNNQYTNFLVDTGASVVALNSTLANSMQVDYLAGKKGAVQTAQGTVEAWFDTLGEVAVGGLRAYNVQAAVIEGDFPRMPLLGMSFLRQVSIEESGGVLTLTQAK